MAGKTKKPEISPYDRFGTDDRAKTLQDMGITNVTFPTQDKPSAKKKPAAKKPAVKKPAAKKPAAKK